MSDDAAATPRTEAEQLSPPEAAPSAAAAPPPRTEESSPPEAAATTTPEDEAPNKPSANPWYQQKVPAYQPLLTPLKIAWILFGAGVVFISIGLAVRSVNRDQIFTRKVQYDGKGTPSENSACRIKESDEGRVCTLTVDIKQKMSQPVFVWYELDNFYQNHNRYTTSFNYEQLLGSYSTQLNSQCMPLKKSGEKDLYPCGLVANSMFNDVITLKNTDVTMRESNLAWASDHHKRFKQPDDFAWSTTTADVSGCLGVICDAGGCTIPDEVTACSEAICQDALGKSACMGYICRGGDFDGGHCAQGSSTVYAYKDPEKYQYLYETYPDIVSPLIGVKNEHFNVWFRLGGLSDFRKLYGRITSSLSKGTTLEFEVKNNFNVDSFDGAKYLVVGTSSKLGGNVAALWMCFTYLGVAMCGVALLFLFKALVLGARTLGDTAYLKG